MGESCLKFKDGTTIDGGTAGFSGNSLWCYFAGMTMQETVDLFLDESKTETIVFEYGGGSETYEGFTNCRVISINVVGMVSVCMAKGEEHGQPN